MSANKRRKTLPVITSLVLALGMIAYLLADRYLIEHVEIADVSAAALPSATDVNTDANTTASSASTAAPAGTVAGTVTAEDWNYRSDSISIAIEKVTTGSGTNALTYFVADIVLTDATSLASAFAKDQFGTNIIETTSTIAKNNNAIFAINGDYYGFRTDGIVIRNGVLYRDEPARTGLAFYTDGRMEVYDETSSSAQELLDAGVWNTLSFGPALLVDGKIPANLTTVEVDTNFGNHSIQGNQPRTAVGIVDSNHFVFVVVDGRSRGYSRGATLTELAQIFQDLGCTEAYNIDGGGSSTMVFRGRLVNNPLGKNRERGTSDILYIGE